MVVVLECHLQIQPHELGHVPVRVRVLGTEHTADSVHLIFINKNTKFKYIMIIYNEGCDELGITLKSHPSQFKEPVKRAFTWGHTSNYCFETGDLHTSTNVLKAKLEHTPDHLTTYLFFLHFSLYI